MEVINNAYQKRIAAPVQVSKMLGPDKRRPLARRRRYGCRVPPFSSDASGHAHAKALNWRGNRRQRGVGA